MSLPEIKTLDVDGALRDAEEGVAADSRADFLRKAALGGGAVLSSGAILAMLPDPAEAQRGRGRRRKRRDVAIANYALTLEYLEAAFYEEALTNVDFTVEGARGFCRLVAKHERIHVRALKDTLGRAAVKSPRFDFGDAVRDEATFLATAYVLENTGVRAYLGQVGRISQRAILEAAGSILTVEARHAAAIGVILGQSPFTDRGQSSITPAGAFDQGQGMKKILRQVGRTGFIQG